jgi:hypothetical protein
MVFLSSYNHDRVLPHPFQFIIHHHPLTQLCLVGVTDSVVKQLQTQIKPDTGCRVFCKRIKLVIREAAQMLHVHESDDNIKSGFRIFSN